MSQDSVSERIRAVFQVVADRLTWRGLEPIAVREDRVTNARTFI
jgi:hypothetical protein